MLGSIAILSLIVSQIDSPPKTQLLEEPATSVYFGPTVKIGNIIVAQSNLIENHLVESRTYSEFLSGMEITSDYVINGTSMQFGDLKEKANEVKTILKDITDRGVDRIADAAFLHYQEKVNNMGAIASFFLGNWLTGVGIQIRVWTKEKINLKVPQEVSEFATFIGELTACMEVLEDLASTRTFESEVIELENKFISEKNDYFTSDGKSLIKNPGNTFDALVTDDFHKLRPNDPFLEKKYNDGIRKIDNFGNHLNQAAVLLANISSEYEKRSRFIEKKLSGFGAKDSRKDALKKIKAKLDLKKKSMLAKIDEYKSETVSIDKKRASLEPKIERVGTN